METNETNSSVHQDFVLRIQKFWFIDDLQMLWLLRPMTRRRELPAKIFIKIALNTQAGCSHLNQKPEVSSKANATTDLLRKFCADAIIKKIQYLQKDGQEFILFPLVIKKNQADFLFEMRRPLNRRIETNPWETQLVELASNESLFRWTSKGVFTKRWQNQFDTKILSQSSSANLLDHFLAPSEAKKADTQTLREKSDDIAEVSSSSYSQLQKDLRSRLKRRLRTLKKSQQKRLSTQKKALPVLELERNAKLMQNFSHLIKEGMFELRIAPELSGEKSEVVIPLDPDKSPGQNINDCFIELKKIRRGAHHLARQEIQFSESIVEAERLLIELSQREYSEIELQDIAHRFSLREQVHTSKKQAAPTRLDKIEKSFKRYFSHDIEIRVGKGPAENDILTKAAASHDFWLHAVGAGGSHVLVSGDRFKSGDLSAEIFKDAAILALHYSNFRNSRAGEVYVTRRHLISKKKGMPPGLWIVENARSVFVKYNEDELKAVLDKLA